MNIVIHTPTKESYDKLMRYLEDKKIYHSFLNIPPTIWHIWYKLEDQTCIKLDGKHIDGFCQKQWYIDKGYKIIGVEEYMTGLYDLKEGDVLVNRYKEEATVLFVLRPGLYVMSEFGDQELSGGVFTAKELGDRTVKGTEEAKEMTVKEVSEKLGYEVKIVKE